jgi:hypothetical protein
VIPWEYGAPPADWVAGARAKSDRVWVPSRYVRERFVAGGMPPGIVEVVPNGFDPRHFNASGPRLELPVRAACVFLFVGGTIWRKGIDLLMSAWAAAFAPDDDVALVIKDFGTQSWYRGQTAQGALSAYARRDDVATVHYLEGELPVRELAALYRAADVLVAPYRGEGFCLPALEAMACGLPIIHNRRGPTSEFVPADAGWAVAAREVAVPDTMEMYALNGNACVHEVEHEALVTALREAAFCPGERRRRAGAALQAAAGLTWKAAAEHARRSLEDMAREALPLARDARPEAVEVSPGQAVVLYAPQWEHEDGWLASLRLWADAFDDSDPVTLALPCRDRDPEQLAAHIADRLHNGGVALDALPDLMLCRSGVRLEDLVAVADAVLVDECDRDRPELVRRALRVVPAEARAIAALRARLAGDVSLRTPVARDLSLATPVAGESPHGASATGHGSGPAPAAGNALAA